jgi:hypothetical protein
MSKDFLERGDAARQERLNQTVERQRQETDRKINGTGSGIIGKGNAIRRKAGVREHEQ